MRQDEVLNLSQPCSETATKQGDKQASFEKEQVYCYQNKQRMLVSTEQHSRGVLPEAPGLPLSHPPPPRVLNGEDL